MGLSIRRYGFWNGGRRGLHRIRRCTGFVQGGVDLP
jgi:putative component of membrane protein insertase Oxa1/YidC/SpoIIIJ protein YidD